ncbi:MAG: hypothetical protein HOQ27_13235 [Dermatophilaceae bacterium]|nr:hypothetical protein [Dermatophilaceae bacterium]
MSSLLERASPLATPPGDPTSIRAAARDLRRVAAQGLACGGLDASAVAELALVWQGDAATRARADLAVLAARTRRVVPHLAYAADGLERYARALEHAVAQAEAIRRRAEAAVDEHARRVAILRSTATDPTTYAAALAHAARDRESALASAHRAHGAVLDELTAAAGQCARRLDALTAEASQRAVTAGTGRAVPAPDGTAGCAPDVRGAFIGDLGFVRERIEVAARPRVGHVAPVEARQWWQDALEDAGNAATWTYNHTAVPLVNGAADVGQAVAEHPEDLLEMALGTGGIILGTGGEIGGTALDATGVGLVVGVPLNVAAAAAAAGGVGAVAHGATSLAEHARANDNRWLTEVDAPTVGRGRPGDPLPDSARPDLAGSNWKGRVAKNGKGEVWQDPDFIGVKGNRNVNSMRIMEPTWRHPNGYVRFYNKHGQPIDIDGKPTGEDFTHLPIRADGTFDIPKGWNP